MDVQNNAVILRPMVLSDIPDKTYWETEETEWQLWDAPWEYDGKTAVERSEDLAAAKLRWRARIEAGVVDGALPLQLEICVNDLERTHIGWCSAYTIDENCCISEDGTRYAIGICLPPQNIRRKGYATEALVLYIQHLLDCGISEIYTQTWSGNVRMVSLASKIGFEEYRRKPGIRMVRGEVYDGLTFRLDLNKFCNFAKS